MNKPMPTNLSRKILHGDLFDCKFIAFQHSVTLPLNRSQVELLEDIIDYYRYVGCMIFKEGGRFCVDLEDKYGMIDGNPVYLGGGLWVYHQTNWVLNKTSVFDSSARIASKKIQKMNAKLKVWSDCFSDEMRAWLGAIKNLFTGGKI